MKKIVLDFTNCNDMHKLLKEIFEFPDYYGENWSAFWDCLRDFYDSPSIVEIYGLYKLPKEFDEDIEIMLRILDRLHAEDPDFEYIVIS